MEERIKKIEELGKKNERFLLTLVKSINHIRTRLDKIEEEEP